MEKNIKHVGFIGVGSIGAPMAKCLIRAGYQMTICDKRPEELERFKEMGAEITDQPADCVDCDMAIVMVADDQQVMDVVLGSGGLLDAVDPNRELFLAVMSTVLPETIQKLAPRCAEKNVKLVDAPVSGFPTRAAEGKLTIMVGGAQEDFEAMQPVFAVMGENVVHTGALGTGEITKLVNNMLGITNLFLSAEAMLMGQRSGMDPHKLAAILESSSGRNTMTKDWEKGRGVYEIFSQNLDLAKVAVDLSLKDLEHAKKLAAGVNVESPLLDQIIQAMRNFSHEEIMERWRAV